MAKLKTRNGTKEHKVVSEAAWLAARKALLVKEKKFTRLLDQLNQQRRNLPWVKVDKEYVFDGPNGKETLAELFGDKSQLVVYHFMFGPGWKEGCPHCSFWCDHYDGARVHLTPHEFGILRLLAQNEGKLLTHRAILREVWGPAYGDESNYLHVYMSQLRRKIEPDPARPRYLLTEPGAGYRLVAPASS